MPTLTKATPKYRKHKASGQAIVTIEGRDFYLGPHGSKASKLEYDRVIGQWIAAGRRLPRQFSPDASDLTVVEVLARFKKHAQKHYRKNGKPTKEWDNFKAAFAPLTHLYGRTLAREFGPLALKTVRQQMVDEGRLSRGVINSRIARIKRAFRWAVSEELVPVEIVIGLGTVAGLQRGRTTAHETAPVRPISDEILNQTIPFLPPVVADMVQLQRLTACRPAEVCSIRPCEVDRSGTVWVYQPEEHKTAYIGRERNILLGPKAQAILRPYLLRGAESFCFSPSDATRKRLEQMRACRKSRVQPSQMNRAKKNPRRKPGDSYTSRSYAYAIRRACKKAGVENWSPNRLRHTAATTIRKQFGLEAAQTVLGHARADVTQVYAERNYNLAERVMRELG